MASSPSRLRRNPWIVVFVALGCVVFTPCAVRAAPPNIVLIVSDDQGYRDLGCFGSDEIKTPHLDRLAAGGVKLTSFYVTWPACTPSRGSLLTGRYPQRNGMYDMVRNEAPDYGKKYTPHDYVGTFERVGGMDVREVLLPRVLKQANYVSGIFGKWDLGIHRRFLPLQRGFDDFYGFVNTGIDYYTHERYGVPSMYRKNKPTTADKGTYATDLFGREAKRFLNAHAPAAARGERPFFLYVPFNAPHSASNLDPKIRSAAQGPDSHKRLYPHLKTAYRESTAYGKPAMKHTRDSRRLEYLASVSAMDDQIGHMLDLLDRHGVADNTIVIFFSDNGGGGGSDNSPLRGGKGSVYEGGIRVPCIVRWPKRIKAGTTSDAFLTSLEILPTLCKSAGIDTAKAMPDVVLDGFDMLPILTDGKPSPRQSMFWQRRALQAARVGNWKWIRTPAGESLYNLKSDIGEQANLAAERGEVVKMMRERFANWKKAMDAAEPRGPFRDY